MKTASKNEMDIERKQNVLASENAKLRADLDYIQIMSGIEIPTDTTGGQGNERMV